MNGRRNRRRGAQTELEVVHMLRDAGVAAEKISGMYKAGPDIVVQDEYLGEVKHREKGWPILTRWMEKVNFLFLRRSGVKEPMVVMRFETFVKLLGGDGG